MVAVVLVGVDNNNIVVFVVFVFVLQALKKKTVVILTENPNIPIV